MKKRTITLMTAAALAVWAGNAWAGDADTAPQVEPGVQADESTDQTDDESAEETAEASTEETAEASTEEASEESTEDAAPEPIVDLGANEEGDAEVIAEIGDGLNPGGHEFQVRGDVQTTGNYDGDRGPADISPTNRGTNTDGPYRFRMRAQMQRDGQQTDGHVIIQLPEGTTPGTYEVQPRGQADDGEAEFRFESSGRTWTFYEEATGELTVGEIGDEVTLSFQVQARSSDGGNAELNGRVYQLPFEPSMAVRATRTVDDRQQDIEWGTLHFDRQDELYQLRVGRAQDAFVLEMPRDLDADTYALSVDDQDGAIRIEHDDFDQVDGELVIERDDDFAHGRFELEASGEATQQISGHFEYLNVISENTGR